MKFWDTFLERQRKIIEATNPKQVKVEQIAMFFFIPFWFAKLLLNLAVKEGSMIKNDDETYFLLEDGM